MPDWLILRPIVKIEGLQRGRLNIGETSIILRELFTRGFEREQTRDTFE